MKAKIKDIKARQILDSRGSPTIEVSVFTGRAQGSFSVPSGASTGSFEAVEKRDGRPDYFQGKGVKDCLIKIKEEILPALKGKNVFDQEDIDQTLISLDGTENKSRLGANTLTAVSLASARTAAGEAKLPLFRYLNRFFEEKVSFPLCYFNLINGGRHARSRLAFQEYHIIPITDSIEEALNIATGIFNRLRDYIGREYDPAFANLGDEGGIVPGFEDVTKPLDILKEIISDMVFACPVKLGVDAAANSFYKNGFYEISSRRYSPPELLEFYKNLAQKFDFLSIEDPFQEEDFDSFAKLNEKVDLIGDDLTVTNVERIKRAIGKVGGIIIKPNQIGTLWETIQAIKLAKRNNLKVIISHRSGETNDSFIADLAVASSAFGIKAGAPQRGERVVKYNRLWHIQSLKL